MPASVQSAKGEHDSVSRTGNRHPNLTIDLVHSAGSADSAARPKLQTGSYPRCWSFRALPCFRQMTSGTFIDHDVTTGFDIIHLWVRICIVPYLH